MSFLKKVQYHTVIGLLLFFALPSVQAANDNLIQATMSQSYNQPLNMDRGDFVFTSTHFRYTAEGLRYDAHGEMFQRAVLMRAANGDRWIASFQMKWVDGSDFGAGLYFAYENMATHYYFGLNGKDIYLIRNGEKLTSIRFQVPKNQWLSIRVRRQLNRFQVYVNGVLRIDHEEDRPQSDSNTLRNPLPYGGYALGTDGDISEDGVVLFKDLMIQGSTSKKPLKHAYIQSVNLKNGKKNVILWLYKQDDRAVRRVRMLARAIQVMEKISGVSYPEDLSAEATIVDFKAPYMYRRLGQTLYPSTKILLSEDKSQDFFNAFASQWDYFQDLWLVGGFPLFLSGVALQDMRGKPFIFKSVPAFKHALDKMNDPKFTDIALDGVYVGPEDVCQEVLRGKEFYAEKGSLFLYMLYRDLGDKKFAQVMARAVSNLSGKKYRRSKRINSVDFLTAAVEITQTHYKAYFNGWIFPGKYSRWSPAFFVDKDQDGLLLFEENLIGTNDEKVDSDGDGYSDLWEYLNGFDPKDKKKPNVAQIAVDGFILDWANFKNIAEVDDPINDISTSYNAYDVRRLMMRADSKFLYIGIQFHNDIRLNVGKKRHRFKFRFDGKEYHTATLDFDEGDFLAQRLKGTDLWYDYFTLDKGFLFESALDIEVRIPLDFFDEAKRIELNYNGSGELKAFQVDYNADPVVPIEVFQAKVNGKEEFINLAGLQESLWGFFVDELKSSGNGKNVRPEMALDRRSETFWEGKIGGDWLQMKMNKLTNARNIILDLDANQRNQLWIEISKDNKKWQTVLKDAVMQPATKQRVIPLQKLDQFRDDFSYIRIHVLRSTGSDGSGRIYEINFNR